MLLHKATNNNAASCVAAAPTAGSTWPQRRPKRVLSCLSPHPMYHTHHPSLQNQQQPQSNCTTVHAYVVATDRHMGCCGQNDPGTVPAATQQCPSWLVVLRTLLLAGHWFPRVTDPRVSKVRRQPQDSGRHHARASTRAMAPLPGT